MRRKLASRPVAEKLRMLDDLRQRELAIRHAVPGPMTAPDVAKEASGKYDAQKEEKK